jgi:hypothetical protein
MGKIPNEVEKPPSLRVLIIAVVMVGLVSIVGARGKYNQENHLIIRKELPVTQLYFRKGGGSITKKAVKAVREQPRANQSGVEQWRPLVSKYFGSATNTALTIMKCESGGRANAMNVNSGGSIDRGLFQINSCHGTHSTFDPEKNVAYAYRLYRSSGWKPWVCASKLGIN